MYHILCIGFEIFTPYDKVTPFGLICGNLCGDGIKGDVEANLLFLRMVCSTKICFFSK